MFSGDAERQRGYRSMLPSATPSIAMTTLEKTSSRRHEPYLTEQDISANNDPSQWATVVTALGTVGRCGIRGVGETVIWSTVHTSGLV